MSRTPSPQQPQQPQPEPYWPRFAVRARQYHGRAQWQLYDQLSPDVNLPRSIYAKRDTAERIAAELNALEADE